MKLIECRDRDHWLSMRREGIGGSDAPAILGLSGRRNKIDIFQAKLGLANEQADNDDAAKWGHRLEPVIRKAFEDESGLKVTYFGPDVIAISDDTPWQRFSPDGMLMHPEHGNTVVQIKNRHAMNHKEWEDGPPDDVVAQVQHEMMVADVNHGMAVALFGGSKLEWFSIFADLKFRAKLMEEESAFWKSVQDQIPPTPATDDEIASLAKTLLEVRAGKTHVISDELERLNWLTRHHERIVRLARKKDDEDWLKRFKNELVVLAGDAEQVQMGDVTYGLKLTKKKSFTMPATTFRNLTLNGAKKDDGDE